METFKFGRRQALAGAAAIVAGPLAGSAQGQVPTPEISGAHSIRWDTTRSLALFTGNGEVAADGVNLPAGGSLPPGVGQWEYHPSARRLTLQTYHNSEEAFYAVSGVLTHVVGTLFRGSAKASLYSSLDDYMANPETPMAVEAIEIAVEKVERA